MSDEKAIERALTLIHTLHNRTREGKIDWRETTDARTFQAESGDFDLRIQLVPDFDYPDAPDYVLHVLKKSTGQEVESISNSMLRPVMDRKTTDGLTPYAVLSEIYQMARRKALRVDEALDSLLQTLQEPR